MNKLILHVGHGKTGSSYIQSFLALNKNMLKNNGFIYPEPNDIQKAIIGHVTSGNGHKFI